MTVKFATLRDSFYKEQFLCIIQYCLIANCFLKCLRHFLMSQAMNEVSDGSTFDLLLTIFKILGILVDMKCYLAVVLMGRSLINS